MFSKYIHIYLVCVHACVCHSKLVELRGGLAGVGSPSTMRVPGIELLRLGITHFYSLGYLSGSSPSYKRFSQQLSALASLDSGAFSFRALQPFVANKF